MKHKNFLYFLVLIPIFSLFFACNEGDSITNPDNLSSEKKLSKAIGSEDGSIYFVITPEITNYSPSSVREETANIKVKVSKLDSEDFGSWSVDIFLNGQRVFHKTGMGYKSSITYEKVHNLNMGSNTIKVKAINEYYDGGSTYLTGEKEKTYTITRKPPIQQPTVAPTLTHSIDYTDGIVTLSWNDITNGHPENIDGYKVYKSLNNGSWQLLTTTTSTYSATPYFASISVNFTYEGMASFKVTAYIEDLQSPYSNVITYAYGYPTSGGFF